MAVDDNDIAKQLSQKNDDGETKIFEFIGGFNAAENGVFGSVVQLHPIPVLSVLYHNRRNSEDSKGKIVGMLMGSVIEDELHITNSFAVVFDELPTRPDVFYLDKSSVTVMCQLLQKINVNEKLIGWYTIGDNITKTDQILHTAMREFMDNPLFLLLSDDPLQPGVRLMRGIESIKDERSTFFMPLPFKICFSKPEEIAVEHILRQSGYSTNDFTLLNATNKLGSALNNISKRLTNTIEFLETISEHPELLNDSAIDETCKKLQLAANSLPTVTDEAKQFNEFLHENCQDQAITFVTFAAKILDMAKVVLDKKMSQKE